MTGGDWNKDNAFRKDMDWSYEDLEIKEHFKKLARIRKEHIALRRGIQKELYVDRNTYAFLRMHPEEEVIAVFNNSEEEQNKDIPVKGSNLIKDKTILKDLMSDQTYTVNQNKLKLTLKPKEAKILAIKRPINSV
ncbi:MAG: alpha-glucosidase C-terminal domain-containing protein [Armatimonadetes bacterium]|nr:alpha-glucosidase C-terminal domain-containing protein [Armatimonadota bacterium]